MNVDGSHDALTDIGHGVSISVRKSYDTGEPAGVYYEHPGKNGATCCGYAPFKPEWADGWDVTSLAPLTISPSLLCRACGHHGFIRNGEWVPC